MRSIQECALDLFDERGFDAVTIAPIAAAAEVSASSVYRYFGTKEGIVVADDFDSLTADELEDVIDADDPVGSLLAAVRSYEGSPTPYRRIAYFFQEPSVRAAVCANLDRASRRITPLLQARKRLTDTQARVLSNAMVFGYFAALEQWYVDGGDKPIAEYVENGLEPLRTIWSSATMPEATGQRPRSRRNSGL